MAMKTCILIIALFAFSVKTRGEEYFQITSLEGKNVKILIEPDGVDNLLLIKLDSGNQICVSQFIGLIHPIKTYKNFLIINLKTRGGSGVALQQLVIVCVSNDRIYKSLHITSADQYTNYLGNVEYNYNISAVEIKQKNEIFLLSLEEHFINMGKQSKINHKLHFDHTLKIFYSKLLPMNGLFNIDCDCGNINKKILFEKDNIFPVVEIVNKYYFINGLWHIHDSESHLTILSNLCCK